MGLKCFWAFALVLTTYTTSTLSFLHQGRVAAGSERITCNQNIGRFSRRRNIKNNACSPGLIGAYNGKQAQFAQTFLLASSFAVNPSIAGGILSGGLHAVTGPDHLAALLPPSVGQSFFGGFKIGAAWGLGHGISATMLGLGAFFLKGKISSKFSFLQGLSTLAESAVGLSLLIIGAIGIKENLESDVWGPDGDGVAPLKSKKAIFANGFLHGFSWDGAPSLAPALAMTSWSSALSFLAAYCVGTMLAMSLTAGIVAESSLRLGQAVKDPKFTRNLSLGSSGLAIIIGLFWIVKAFLH